MWKVGNLPEGPGNGGKIFSHHLLHSLLEMQEASFSVSESSKLKSITLQEEGGQKDNLIR